MSDDYAGPGVPTFGPPVGMCPHCGVMVVVENGLTSEHLEGHIIQHPCPGSHQNARCAESDGRPLWNGQPNAHYYRNQAAHPGSNAQVQS